MKNIVDSSGWLEYLADAPNADFFAPAIEDTTNLLVPTISLLEVFKRVLGQRGEDSALQAVALMQQGRVIDLTGPLAVEAAILSHQRKLPLADSVMLATAQKNQALLWTQDADFKGIDNVKYTPKHK